MQLYSPFYSLSHRTHAGRSSHTTRCLALSLCLTAGLALSACGPAHKGQLTVEPVSASAEASASNSATPSKKPSPTATASSSTTPSTAPTWSRPSVSFTDENSSVWHRDDSLANTDSNSDERYTEGYGFNDGSGCQGYISQRVSQDYFKPTPVDTLDSIRLVSIQSSEFSTFEITSGPSTVDTVRDDNGTMPGYEIAYNGTVNFSNAPNTPVVGYRFTRVVGEKGYVFTVGAVCPPESPISLEQWHTILAGIKVTGLDAG